MKNKWIDGRQSCPSCGSTSEVEAGPDDRTFEDADARCPKCRLEGFVTYYDDEDPNGYEIEWEDEDDRAGAWDE